MRPLIIIVLIKVMAVNVYPRRVLLVRKNIRAVRILGVNRDAESGVGGKDKKRVSEASSNGKGEVHFEVSRETPGEGGVVGISNRARVENKGRRSGKEREGRKE